MATLCLRRVALILFFSFQPQITYTVEEAKLLSATWSPSIKQFFNAATDWKAIDRCSADAAEQLLKMRRCIAPMVGPYNLGTCKAKGARAMPDPGDRSSQVVAACEKNSLSADLIGAADIFSSLSVQRRGTTRCITLQSW